MSGAVNGGSPQQLILGALLEQGRVFAELLHLTREVVAELRELRAAFEGTDTTPAYQQPYVSPATATQPQPPAAPAPATPGMMGAMERVLQNQLAKAGIDPSALMSGDGEQMMGAMLERAANTPAPATPQPSR